MPDDFYKQVIEQIECPRCKAAPGAHCKTTSAAARKIYPPHEQRRALLKTATPEQIEAMKSAKRTKNREQAAERAPVEIKVSEGKHPEDARYHGMMTKSVACEGIEFDATFALYPLRLSSRKEMRVFRVSGQISDRNKVWRALQELAAHVGAAGVYTRGLFDYDRKGASK